jgi:hypothetical protein
VYGICFLKFSAALLAHKGQLNNADISVAEPHHFHAAPALGKIFDAASAAPGPAPTLRARQNFQND